MYNIYSGSVDFSVMCYVDVKRKYVFSGTARFVYNFIVCDQTRNKKKW